ncbi:MAG: TIGR00266 family protein [Candidatus Woesearchaeota archaeon]
MNYKIRGTTLQIADIQLSANESIYTERGGMSWMSDNIKMETNMKGGLGKGIMRAFSGESMFLTTYTCESGQGLISFANEFPGKIVPMKLGETHSIICQKDSFMVAENTVKLDIHFQKKFGAGLFGGEGFIMQKISGTGTAFLEVAGEITEYVLNPGQILKVDPGHIAFMQASVEYDIVSVKGFKNVFFGGEGLFLAELKGPGKVWLQSMPISNLAMKLAKYMPHK